MEIRLEIAMKYLCTVILYQQQPPCNRCELCLYHNKNCPLLLAKRNILSLGRVQTWFRRLEKWAGQNPSPTPPTQWGGEVWISDFISLVTAKCQLVVSSFQRVSLTKFLPLVFWIQHLLLGPCFKPYTLPIAEFKKTFSLCSLKSRLIVVNSDSAVSMTKLSHDSAVSLAIWNSD